VLLAGLTVETLGLRAALLAFVVGNTLYSALKLGLPAGRDLEPRDTTVGPVPGAADIHIRVVRSADDGAESVERGIALSREAHAGPEPHQRCTAIEWRPSAS
jgi:hypothetical protein